MLKGWTEEQLTELKQLLLSRDADGRPSYSEIGAKIGKSKGAIAGYVNRHQRLRPPVCRKPRPPPQRKLVVAQQQKLVVVQVPNNEPVPLKEPLTPIDSRRECSFIHGHPFEGEWRYCGHRTIKKSSYCAYHHGVTTYVLYGERGKFSTKPYIVVDKTAGVSD